MKLKYFISIPAIVLLVILTGCKEDNFVEIEGICPEVVATSPENDFINTPLDKEITVSFNEAMNAATINQVSFTLGEEGLILGTISYSGRTATFTPAGLLTPNTYYSGLVTTAAKDLMGNALQEDYEWSFETGSTVAPRIIHTDPANTATGVMLNKTILATFDIEMDPATINAVSFSVKQGMSPVSGTVTYFNTRAYFNPDDDLLINSEYEATISVKAKNNAGVGLLNDYVWSFSTGNILAPTIVCNDPEDMMTDVVRDKVVSVCFSEMMNPATINATTFSVKLGATTVEGNISYTDSFASFTPIELLIPGGFYTARITTGIENTAGIPLANEFEWSFTVKL